MLIVAIFLLILLLVTKNLSLNFIWKGSINLIDLKWFNDNIGITNVILTGAYVIVTFFILRSNQKTVKEMRLAREQQIKPSILISFEVRRKGMFCLVVRNLGGSPARNLRISINDLWIQCLPMQQIQERFLKLKSASLTIVPKQEILFCIGGTSDYEKISKEDLRGIVTYLDIFNRQCIEEFYIDIDSYGGALIYGPEIDELTGTIKNGLEEIKREIINSTSKIEAMAEKSNRIPCYSVRKKRKKY